MSSDAPWNEALAIMMVLSSSIYTRVADIKIMVIPANDDEDTCDVRGG